MRRYDCKDDATDAIDLKLLKGRRGQAGSGTENPEVTWQNEAAVIRQGDPVDAETLTDITDCMDMEKRLLTLDVKDGAWSIFILYLTRKGGEEATKDYLNPLVKKQRKFSLMRFMNLTMHIIKMISER